MKEYGLIVIGTGSAMNIVDPMIRDDPSLRIAVIDKDEPGGICLTRGCIPSKILLYPAELVSLARKANGLGIRTKTEVDFSAVMGRMRTLIDADIESIRRGLTESENIDYYRKPAEFVAPYTLKVGEETIHSDMIFLCTGSKTTVPPIRGLEEAGFLTSDEVLKLKRLPKSVAVIGGGYIAAELGFFLAAMGSNVTLLGRNPQFLPDEEPEVSEVLREDLESWMKILTGLEVLSVTKSETGLRIVSGKNIMTGEVLKVTAEEVLVAAGRGPVTDILHPEKGGIEVDEEGWIKVNEYLETSQPNIWAMGDADGRFPFKHVANYESEVVYYNAVLKRKVKADYHAVPHAVFTYPEAAGVGMREEEAVTKYGKEGVKIGFYRYEDTAKGEAIEAKSYFVKVIMEGENESIVGAHIAGPSASVLIQEIINVMYADDRGPGLLRRSMYIHPALNEVVQRAMYSVYGVDEYHHMLSHRHGEEGVT